MMAREDACALCEASLDEACRRYGAEFCELRARYLAERATAEEMARELAARLDPGQMREIRESLIDRGLAAPRGNN